MRHRDAVEEEERTSDRLNVLDCFPWGRRLVAVEASAYEPHTRVRDRCEGRRRHAGRAADADDHVVARRERAEHARAASRRRDPSASAGWTPPGGYESATECRPKR